jgi:hypothetical protein
MNCYLDLLRSLRRWHVPEANRQCGRKIRTQKRRARHARIRREASSQPRPASHTTSAARREPLLISAEFFQFLRFQAGLLTSCGHWREPGILDPNSVVE